MLHVEQHISPKMELFLRKGVRAACWVALMGFVAYMALIGLKGLLSIPAFVFILKAVLAIAVSTAVLVLFLWAIGEENKRRIDELEELMQEDDDRQQ